MNIEEFRDYCIAKPGVTEEFPFDETTLVFKVAGKMFALTDLEDEFTINIKCDPEKAIELRERYPESVMPGYHMSKKHWNTIRIDGHIPDTKLLEWVDDSYNLVLSKLPKAVRKKLNTD